MKDYEIISQIRFARLQSNLMQFYLTIKLRAKNVLEIGKNIGFVSSMLEPYCNLTTLDFKEENNPDLLIDITNSEQLNTLKNNDYDLILICEVLEHIPYEKVEEVLRIIKNKTKEYVVISVPNRSIHVNMTFFKQGFGKLGRIIKKITYILSFKIGNIITKLDYRFKNKYKKFIFGRDSSEHHWELGVDKYNVKSFKRLLEKYFIIIKEERFTYLPYHHFFILKKRGIEIESIF